MFDRRFDDSEDDLFSEPVDMTTKSVDGIPSISELLDTLNNRMEAAEKQTEENAEQPEPQKQDGAKTVADSASESENEPAADPENEIEPPAERLSVVPPFTGKTGRASRRTQNRLGRSDGFR